jgi:hypothetical protein
MAQNRGKYVTDEQWAEVHQGITEAQFREMHRLAGSGHESARFKDWCEHFIVDVPTDRVLAPVLAYLREQGLAHTFEVVRRWVPSA